MLLGVCVELTKRLLAEIVESLRSHARGGIEKRQHPRVGMRLKAHMLRQPFQGRPLTIWVRDISSGGMGILCDQVLQEGEPLRITFSDDPEHSVECKASYRRRVSSNLFQIGLRFDDQTSASLFPTTPSMTNLAR
jgi:hypothetical protein